MNGQPSAEADPDGEWARQADARDAQLPRLSGRYPIAGLIRRARRLGRLSQRELARRVGVSPSTVGRVESGAIVPTLPAFERMLAVAGLWLVVVDDEGHIVTPMRDIDDIRNGGGWRYPSHLDVILDPRDGEWWADKYGLARPPETFHRDPWRRAAQRARSVWEVRAANSRNVPPPPDPAVEELARARWASRSAAPEAPPVDTRDLDVDEWSEDDARAWADAAGETTTHPDAA